MSSRQGSDRLITGVYRHDVINPLQILEMSYIEDSGVVSFEEIDEKNFEEFLGVLDAAVERLKSAEDLEFAAKEIYWLTEYEGEFSGEIGEKVDEIADLSQDVLPYLQVSEKERNDDIDLKSILEPIEEEGELDYNGLSSAKVYGDMGLGLVANTIALNFREHAAEADELYAEVKEEDDFYRIDIWDDGPGVEGYEGDEIFRKGKGDNSGNGLYFADQITDMFDGELVRSEENEKKEDGFGLEWYLRPAQYSTSDPE